ncbi:MAG: hypothetical protein ACRDRV_13780 [Pseudonocardiaceae bacterium]
MNPAGTVAFGSSVPDGADEDGSTRALIALGLVSVLLGVVVGWLWWSDQRAGQVVVARQEGLRSAREQVVTVLSNPTTGATVLAAGVVRAEPGQAVVLLFVNQATRRPQSNEVQLSAHRIELTMKRVDGRWRVAHLKRV